MIANTGLDEDLFAYMPPGVSVVAGVAQSSDETLLDPHAPAHATDYAVIDDPIDCAMTDKLPDFSTTNRVSISDFDIGPLPLSDPDPSTNFSSLLVHPAGLPFSTPGPASGFSACVPALNKPLGLEGDKFRNALLALDSGSISPLDRFESPSITHSFSHNSNASTLLDGRPHVHNPDIQPAHQAPFSTPGPVFREPPLLYSDLPTDDALDLELPNPKPGHIGTMPQATDVLRFEVEQEYLPRQGHEFYRVDATDLQETSPSPINVREFFLSPNESTLRIIHLIGWELA